VRGFVQIFLDALHDAVEEPFGKLRDMQVVDTAEGVWLDYIGERLGMPRPFVTEVGDRFGFSSYQQAYDQAPYAGSQQNADTAPMADHSYRRILQARAYALTSRGSFRDLENACRAIDPDCVVFDNLDMTIRVTTRLQGLMEIAHRVGALPLAAGVAIDFDSQGLFGFDDSGQPFDIAPFDSD